MAAATCLTTGRPVRTWSAKPLRHHGQPRGARRRPRRPAQQVPAVRHLDRVRRALAHAVRVGASPVARDDLDPGMLTKPTGQGVGLPVRQQVHDLVALQVDQGRPVAVAPAPGPVIDGEDARRRRGPTVIAGLASHPQQRVGADRHGQPLGQAPARLAAERMGKMTLQVAQPPSPARSHRRTDQALGEGLAGAGWGEAAKTPSNDLQRYWTALPGQIGKDALVAAMEPLRHLGAGGTRGRRLIRAGCDDDVIGGGHDPHDCEAGRDQGQYARGQGGPSTRRASLRAHPTPQRQHGKCGRTRNSLSQPVGTIDLKHGVPALAQEARQAGAV